MAEMTSRERVVAALNRQGPDRVPLDIGGGQSTSLVVEAYENFKSPYRPLGARETPAKDLPGRPAG